jgi:hypothetical protein
VKTEIAITSFIKNVQNLLYKTISPSSKNCNNNGETTTKPKRRRIRSFMKFTDKLTFELALDLCVGDFISPIFTIGEAAMTIGEVAFKAISSE